MSKTHSSLSHTPLGAKSPMPLAYAPELLCAVERLHPRVSSAFRFGDDLWQLWELSWRDLDGHIEIAAARLSVPCHSPRVCESKSLKLYLMSLNDERFVSRDAVKECIVRDVSRCCGETVTWQWAQPHLETATLCASPSVASASVALDTVRVAHGASVLAATPEQAADLLRCDPKSPIEHRSAHTHAFRSLCPVTGQPDWASVFVQYRGRAIDSLSLLQYLMSYRHHGAMHESCVELIFDDLFRRCAPEQLSVDAKFLRRGGIDINPFRSTWAARQQFTRLWRQ